MAGLLYEMERLSGIGILGMINFFEDWWYCAFDE